MHLFNFHGGSFKPNEHATCKFFLFALLDDEEAIFYDAVKRGIFVSKKLVDGSEVKPHSYQSLVRDIKIFTSSQGFGLDKSYFSFFFRMGGQLNKTITITPFSDRRDYFFRAKGRFLSNEEIKKRFEGTDTYKFYKRQKYLSKAELNDIIRVEEEGQISSTQVRLVRV